MEVGNEEGGAAKLKLSDNAVASLGLKTGIEVAATDVLRAVDQVRAEEVAVGALARRAHSRRELELLLQKKGVPKSIAVAEISRLSDQGYVNDTNFAEQFARFRVASRGASVWSLRRDLAKRGIAKEVADSAISDALRDADVDESAMARREAAKRSKRLQKLDPQVARRRLIAFLQRRGFSGAAIGDALRSVRDGSDEAD